MIFFNASAVSLKNKSDILFFHFNYYQHLPLIKHVREKYPFGRTIFTIHFQDWCFALKGNTSYFKRIINTEKEQLKDDSEKNILIQYEEDVTIYNTVNNVICLSEYTRKLLIEDYKIPDKKISLIYNVLKDEAVFLSKNKKASLKKRLFIDEKDKIILFAGRLDDIKGVDVLIKAFKLLLRKNTDYHLVIAGDGNYPVYLKECNDIWHKITFTGRLDKNELYRYYQLADIGVMPSTHEQCSYVAIEMMMFGLPVVASDSTGLSEMFSGQNSRYKIKVKENNDNVSLSPVILKNKIIAALSNNDYGTRLRKQYENVYTDKIMRDKYLKIYENFGSVN